MLSGLIIYSRVDKDKNAWFINRCIELLQSKGVSLSYLDEDDVLDYVKNHQVDFVIYRAREYRLLKEIQAQNIRCFNNAFTNKIANDKYLTYEFLDNEGVECLRSFLSPEEVNSVPFVMKSVDGHGGEEVYLLKAKDEIERYQKPNKRYIFQEYYQADGDLRLYVLNKQVVGAVLRQNKDDFRSNFSLGGEIVSFEPDEYLVNTAIKVAKLLNADYIGVDFLKVNDKWLVNEIEDPVGARMLYKASGVDIVSLFADYIYRTLTNK